MTINPDEIGPDGTLIYSTLTCPACGHVEKLDMPPSSYQTSHRCSGCKTVLKAKPGDCCVFCSCGDTPCPPEQLAGKNCCGRD